jgi:hypothetical protein
MYNYFWKAANLAKLTEDRFKIFGITTNITNIYIVTNCCHNNIGTTIYQYCVLFAQ